VTCRVNVAAPIYLGVLGNDPTLSSIKESYQVILTAPSLPIGQNAANPTGRTLYASTDLAVAQAFCDRLQTYMPHLASPVGSALRAS
jgi:hypothetical protein